MGLSNWREREIFNRMAEDGKTSLPTLVELKEAIVRNFQAEFEFLSPLRIFDIIIWVKQGEPDIVEPI